jgi:hypothetical protein
LAEGHLLDLGNRRREDKAGGEGDKGNSSFHVAKE